VLKGDLGATPLSDVLTDLAAQEATGCLHIDDDSGDEALVYLKKGLVYSAYVPGRRPQLGARLISSGALAPEAMAEALEAQATELQGWRLGELLVHLGYVERPVVEAFVLEQLRESVFDLTRWTSGRFRFRKNEKTREDVGTHASVLDLLAEAARRRAEWETIAGVVHGPGAVPVLSAGGLAAGEMTLDQDQWALLCKVDGERTITQLARDCGFTTFEAGQIVYALVGAGLLDVEETVEESEPYAGDEDLRPVAAAIASVLGPSAPMAVETVETVEAGDMEPDSDSDSDQVAALRRISSALFVPLTPGESYEEYADLPESGSEISRLLGGSPPEPESEPAVAEPVDPVEAVDAAEAAEPVEEPPALALPEDLTSELASLTAAIADLPSLGLPASLEPEFPTMPEPEAYVPEPVAEPVVEEPVVEAPVAAEPGPVAAAAEDPFGDSLARVSEALNALLGDALPTVKLPEAPPPTGPSEEELAAARAEAERLERSRAAAAAELAEAHAMAEAARQGRTGGARFGRRSRIEAERKAADEAAAAEAAQAAAEAAEAARVEAERLEAERAAAEAAVRDDEAARLAEEATRAEAERLAAEQAEAERLVAEAAAEEAARQEAERAAAEEAERLAAEQAAAEETARQEAARAAAARLAAEEAERAEAVRLASEAAEEAARAEAERLAAEQAEADRVAAEQAAEESARAEFERLAAEQAEADRLAAEQAAEEAARAEAERLAGEADEAAVAEAEPEQRPVDAATVASLLRDFNDSPADALTDTVETIEEYIPDDPADDEGAPSSPTGADPAPAYANGSRSGLSETAALLRELTSLGLDDEPSPQAAPAHNAAKAAATAKPAQPSKDPKKRKGLFGRG
jgi:hypothetical protein